jgi:hypothetical protein
MSDEPGDVSVESGWHPAPPVRSEEWVLAGSAVGWVRAETLGEVDEILAGIAQLELRRDRLAGEVAAELGAARRRGAEEGAEAVATLLTDLAAYRRRLAHAAADAAFELAVGAVGDVISTDASALEAFVLRALGDLGEVDALAIEVSPSMVVPVSALFDSLSVVAASDLEVTDVRLILPSGKKELRLARVLESLRGAVLETIESSDG